MQKGAPSVPTSCPMAVPCYPLPLAELDGHGELGELTSRPAEAQLLVPSPGHVFMEIAHTTVRRVLK